MIDADREAVLVDPWGRRMGEVFSGEDRLRLERLAVVMWGLDDPMPIDDARRAMADAVAVVTSGWRYGPLPPETRLRAIIDVGGGFAPTIDYDECDRRGIRVLTAAPGFARQVAEMALGMALASAREIVAGDRDMRVGNEAWQHAGNETTFMLFGKPVGMIGYGAIARALRPLLQPFGCRIRAFDPLLADGHLRSLEVEPVGLEELLETSRVIFVLAAPMTDNAALLSRAHLERIAPGSVLVLISRAHVVDFDALTELAIANRLKVAVDVFPTEPLANDHPIRRAPGAVLSAHRAGSVREGLWDLGELVVDDLEAIVRGLTPRRLQAATPEIVARILGRTAR